MNDILTNKAIKGDGEALYLLILDIKGKLYRIAYSYLKNEEDSLEAIQETSYRAYLKIKNLKHPEFFKTWITRILINYCCDEIRRKKKFTNYKIDEASSYDSDRVKELTIKDYLNSLDEKYREVIVLKYFEEYKVKEIAYIKNIPEGTVKTRLKRGLAILEKELERGEFNE